MSNTTPPNLVVDPFCFRQFQEKRPKITTEDAAGNGYTGTIFDISIADFEKIVNKRYREEDLQEGYAPFCKHLFVTNDFTNAVVNVLPITPENEGLLRTKYEARNEKELPVLVRFFPKELQRQQQQLPKAKYLDLILYSREQIQKENEAQQQQQLGDAMSSSSSSAQAHAALPPLSPWGIVSIKAQDLNRELPMNPITVMRNALGKEHGGSGIPLDRKAYLQAVDYWNNHAVVADT